MAFRSVKYTFFLFLFVLYQQAFPQYPKRANLAIIENKNLSNSLLMYECVRILNTEGYEICKMKADILFLTTMAYPLDDLPVLVYYRLNITGTTILLRGYIMDNRDFNAVGIPISRRSWERSAYRSMNGSLWKTGFEDMIKVAEMIRAAIIGVTSWAIEEDYEVYYKCVSCQ